MDYRKFENTDGNKIMENLGKSIARYSFYSNQVINIINRS